MMSNELPIKRLQPAAINAFNQSELNKKILLSTKVALSTFYINKSLQILDEKHFADGILDSMIRFNCDDIKALLFKIDILDIDSILERLEFSAKRDRDMQFSLINANEDYFIAHFSVIPESQRTEDNYAQFSLTALNAFMNRIKALEASELSMRTYFEEDPVMHLSIDPHRGFVLGCNMFLINTLGYTSKSDVIGKPINNIFDVSEKKRILKLIRLFLETGQIRNEHLTLMTKDSSPIEVEVNSNAVYDINGNILFSRTILTDISKIIKAKEILEFQKETLASTNVELEQFAAVCSHDLKAPLNTIKISSDIILKKYGEKMDDKGKSYLNYIGEATMRMARQINALMDHARLGTTASPVETDLNQVLNNVISDLSSHIENTTATVTKGTMPTIYAYREELRVLFQNLIGNAIKYSRENVPPQIVITASSLENHFLFSIKDNGLGIPKEDAKKVFKLFERSDNGSEREGTGIGLAHCYKIAKLHGGNIWVDSKVGEGSVFHVKVLNNLGELQTAI